MKSRSVFLKAKNVPFEIQKHPKTQLFNKFLIKFSKIPKNLLTKRQICTYDSCINFKGVKNEVMTMTFVSLIVVAIIIVGLIIMQEPRFCHSK